MDRYLLDIRVDFVCIRDKWHFDFIEDYHTLRHNSPDVVESRVGRNLEGFGRFVTEEDINDLRDITQRNNNYVKSDMLDVNNSVSLLIKSFMRKECVDKLISSIRQRYSEIKIIVVDDSRTPLNFDYDDNIKTYNLPFDSGLSICRNFGVSKIETEYFILLDDDFIFTDSTDIQLWLDIFKKSNLDIMGGYLYENKKPLKYFGTFEFDAVTRTLTTVNKNQDYGFYKTCDIIPNFFISKTEVIKKCRWDDDLKLCEHTAFFFKHKNRFKVGFTNKISIIHNRLKYPEYDIFRDRGKIFLKFFMQKENINQLVAANGINYHKDYL